MRTIFSKDEASFLFFHLLKGICSLFLILVVVGAAFVFLPPVGAFIIGIAIVMYLGYKWYQTIRNPYKPYLEYVNAKNPGEPSKSARQKPPSPQDKVVKTAQQCLDALEKGEIDPREAIEQLKRKGK